MNNWFRPVSLGTSFPKRVLDCQTDHRHAAPTCGVHVMLYHAALFCTTLGETGHLHGQVESEHLKTGGCHTGQIGNTSTGSNCMPSCCIHIPPKKGAMELQGVPQLLTSAVFLSRLKTHLLEPHWTTHRG